MPNSTPDLLIASSAAPVPVIRVTKESVGDVLEGLGGVARDYAEATGYAAAPRGTCLVPGEGGLGAVLHASEDPYWAGALGASLPAGEYEIADSDPLDALAWCLGAYRFERYKTGDEAREAPRLVVPDDAVRARALREAEASAFTRDLVNTPASDMGPAEIEAAARGLADRFDAEIEVVDGEALETGFPMVHAVGRASVRAPRLIDLTWGEAAHPAVTLVGKGVAYDTGGLNIKPGNAMRNMKKDMGGAANALGLAHLVMASKLPVRLRVLIPAVENAINGNAFRPGDVLTSRKGLTVEIDNTDAEGRLVLADALTYAQEGGAPDLLIDLATLTGAARVALGPEVMPFYTDDETLAAQIAAGAAATEDPLWRMPLWQGYDSWLSSKVADVCHTASRPFAGSVTAALFLNRFVETPAWVHLDIFAWNAASRPARPEGGEAQGLRALFAMLDARYGGAS